MSKNSWEIESKDYFARVRIKKTQKDGEYYDILFGLKKQGRDMRLHFGIKVVAEEGVIGGKIFFIEPRKIVSQHIEETINPKTGEVISRSDIPYRQDGGKLVLNCIMRPYMMKSKKRHS